MRTAREAACNRRRCGEGRCAAPLAVWGAQVTMAVEARFAEHLLTSWTAGRSSLRGVPFGS